MGACYVACGPAELEGESAGWAVYVEGVADEVEVGVEA